MSDLLRQIASDPRLQRSLQKFMPAAAPSPAPSPTTAPLEGELAKLAARVDALSAGNPVRTALRAQGYSVEGCAMIEALAQQRGIDHVAAAAVFDRLYPPPEPLMGGSRYFPAPAPPRPPDLRLLFEGREEEFLGDAVANAIAEVRGL